MKQSDPNWDEYTITGHLRALNFHFSRFEENHDVDDLDCAERHAEVVREYLSEVFREINLRGLNNLYLGSNVIHHEQVLNTKIGDQKKEINP